MNIYYKGNGLDCNCYTIFLYRSFFIYNNNNYVFNYNILKNIRCSAENLLASHQLNLLTILCKEYLKVRLHYVAKTRLGYLLLRIEIVFLYSL